MFTPLFRLLGQSKGQNTGFRGFLDPFNVLAVSNATVSQFGSTANTKVCASVEYGSDNDGIVGVRDCYRLFRDKRQV